MLNQVQSQLTMYQHDRVKKSFEDGMRATSMARKRVKEHIQRTADREEQGIENLIK